MRWWTMGFNRQEIEENKKKLYNLSDCRTYLFGYTDISFEVLDDLREIKKKDPFVVDSHLAMCVEGAKAVYYTDLGGFTLPKMAKCFFSLPGLKRISLKNVYTSNVEDMSYLFYDTDIEYLDVSQLNMKKVKTMLGFCGKCKNLKTIKLFQEALACVTMRGFFAYCESLEEVDFGEMVARSLNEVSSFFFECKNLKRVTGQVIANEKISVNFVFYECRSLKEIKFPFISFDYPYCVGTCWKCSNLETFETKHMLITENTRIEQFFDGCDSLKNVTFNFSSDFRVLKKMTDEKNLCDLEKFNRINEEFMKQVKENLKNA